MTHRKFVGAFGAPPAIEEVVEEALDEVEVFCTDVVEIEEEVVVVSDVMVVVVDVASEIVDVDPTIVLEKVVDSVVVVSGLMGFLSEQLIKSTVDNINIIKYLYFSMFLIFLRE